MVASRLHASAAVADLRGYGSEGSLIQRIGRPERPLGGLRTHRDPDLAWLRCTAQRKSTPVLAEPLVHGGEEVEERELEYVPWSGDVERGRAILAELVAGHANASLDQGKQLIEELIESEAGGGIAFGSKQLKEPVDQRMQAPGLVFDDACAFEGGVRILPADANSQDFEIDDDRVERVLDLVGDVIGEAADELEAERAQLLVGEPRYLL